MKSFLTYAGVLLTAAAAAYGCSNTPSISSGGFDCKTTYGDACGATCDATKANSCESGLFCGTGNSCTAECSPSQASQCVDGTCSADGRCDGGLKSDKDGGSGSSNGAGGVLGGGAAGNANDGGSTAGAAGAAGAAGGSGCLKVNVDYTEILPNVMLLVARSGSMNASDIAGSTDNRWVTIKNALIGSDGIADKGLIGDLQKKVRFGLTTYTAESPSDSFCPLLEPLLTVSTPMLNAHSAIDTSYRSLDYISGGDTPTGDAIAKVYPELAKITATGPKVILLATDGEPDSCADRNNSNADGKNKAILEAGNAYDAGVQTFVVYVSTPSNAVKNHLQELANVGRGLAKDTAGTDAATYYAVNSTSALEQAFDDIVQSVRSCDIDLNGTIAGDASKGTVKLNGTSLTYGDADGWEKIDSGNIRILGSACSELKNGGKLAVDFPCGVFTPEIQ